MSRWTPPTSGIARLGELRHLVIDSSRGRLLWRGCRIFKLPESVVDPESLEEFEDSHDLPDIDERFHLGVGGDGKQLLIIPYKATSEHGAGLGSGAEEEVHDLLRAFLGRNAEHVYDVDVRRPRNVTAIGSVRLIVYAANKNESV